ncbi:flagellar biosynthesis protein FlhF [Campylobacter sp. CCUG 57310]|uniref:flagellar biosynthesis protein FlhF n=1 Tax=Campylobacter sp. CCUG 57310 TaxID=2517362 RepID=UPI001564CECA|nr:flagellar biosynthesis protein FlhF [Campylobacter sp. CCUG 57310]QKF92775.1 polar flagellar biogenesis protein FlhF [Campylobacter sp. CCUG 57310]
MATKLYTFTGESSIEALKKAQEQCGERAMLVTTKQIRPKTINKKPLYEILVSVEEEDEPKQVAKSVNLKGYDKFQNQNNKFEQRPKFEIEELPLRNDFTVSDDELFGKSRTKNDFKSDDNILVNISKAAKEISEITKSSGMQSIQNDNPEGYSKKIDDVAKQMNALSDKVNLIADMIWEEKAPGRNNLVIPPEFASIYKAAKKSGMKEEHLEAIMQTTTQNMPTSMKTNPNAVKRYFYSLLRKMLPCRIEQDNKKQKIMMLVGPTGVGKTTTLAKLAARFAYSGEKRYKTGIITLDTYRIGAVEQLFQYAKMMKLPILDVIEVEDFKSAIKQLNHCDVILIDTTGNSQYDKEKLARLEKFLKSADAQIDVNLVLSAGSKVEDLLEIYDGFSFLDIDTLIITKFDETKIFGNVFSLIYETNTPVSFFSVGQEVPDDIMVAKSEFLVECVLEGFEKEANDE